MGCKLTKCQMNMKLFETIDKVLGVGNEIYSSEGFKYHSYTIISH